MKKARRPLLIGNWKLNHTRSSAQAFFKAVLPTLSNSQLPELAIAPVAPMLEMVGSLIKDSPISLAAQNVYFMDHGAYTGEWSVTNLKELDVKFCLVGHSERRRIFHESDNDIAKKTKALLLGGIVPVCCIGETAAERKAGLTMEILERQIAAIIEDLSLEKQEIVFAYEPVWAIGTGQSASKEQAEEAHRFIRERLLLFYGKEAAERVRILYGGSVTPQNLKDFMLMPDIDGALVGGASLQVDSFLSMVKEL